jgi:hypothetical protein
MLSLSSKRTFWVCPSLRCRKADALIPQLQLTYLEQGLTSFSFKYLLDSILNCSFSLKSTLLPSGCENHLAFDYPGGKAGSAHLQVYPCMRSIMPHLIKILSEDQHGIVTLDSTT